MRKVYWETTLILDSIDLREEVVNAALRGEQVEAVKIGFIEDGISSEHGEALYLPSQGRIGISCDENYAPPWHELLGVDSDWASVDSIDAGIQMWAYDGDEWTSHG